MSIRNTHKKVSVEITTQGRQQEMSFWQLARDKAAQLWQQPDQKHKKNMCFGSFGNQKLHLPSGKEGGKTELIKGNLLQKDESRSDLHPYRSYEAHKTLPESSLG